MMMVSRCQYQGTTPTNNNICDECDLYLHTCQAVATDDGYAVGSECGDYFYCEGCQQHSCSYKSLN